jgi:hypothetical protein
MSNYRSHWPGRRIVRLSASGAIKRLLAYRPRTPGVELFVITGLRRKYLMSCLRND